MRWCSPTTRVPAPAPTSKRPPTTPYIASAALSGNVNNLTATTFTFGGSTYLAINQMGAGFQDNTDLLLDITGATGTISASAFTGGVAPPTTTGTPASEVSRRDRE